MSLHDAWLRGDTTAVLEPPRPSRERRAWSLRRAVLWATLTIELLVIAGLATLYVLAGVYLLRGGR